MRGAGALEGLDGTPTPLDASAYAIVVMAVAGIPFAVLWARTRNLRICMAVHAATDTIPYLSDFVRDWGIGQRASTV